MSEMIEKVARAIYREMTIVSRGDVPDDWEEIGPDHQGNRDDWMSIARAAIEAMREPIKVQLEAAEDIVVGYDDFACGDGNIYLGIPGYPQNASDVWSALIDAALSETKQ